MVAFYEQEKDMQEKADADLRATKAYVEDKDRSSKLGSILQKSSAATERVPTGIPGFDELIEGGLRSRTIVLVEGGAGTGKSIFSTQYLYNGIIKYHQNGIYISFEEEKEDFFANMRRFGWDLARLEAEKKFLFLRYLPEQVEKVLAAGGGIIRDAVDSISAKRIVIDSMTAFSLLHDDELSKREALLTLFRIIKKWDCTTVVIGQTEMGDDDSHHFDILEFECDGVIRLYHRLEHNIRQRMTEVYKMRGTKHAEKTFTMEIAKAGIIVYPENNTI